MSFLDSLKKMTNTTTTQNGALSYKSTNSKCLDLFYMAGAMRNSSDEDIKDIVTRAFIENKDYTMKILFFARDVRGGLGERRFFRIAMQTVAELNSDSINKNIGFIPEYGRWDDILELNNNSKFSEKITEIIKNQLETDKVNMTENKEVSLLAKWLPSVNTSSEDTVKMAKKLSRQLGMNEREYRKTLSSLRKYIDILESRLRVKDYTFDYSKQPSKAMMKYRKAFIRNDKARYMYFINSVLKGEQKLNASTLYPYEIVNKVINADENERKVLDASWKSLSDIDNSQNAIAVVDGSGSMTWNRNKSVLPIDVAVSLGIYFAEHNKGIFRNHFITFSMNPRLIEIKGNDIYEKVRYIRTFNECANTDVQKVFDLILDTAVKNKTPQEELPETIYIISDMEFDSCAYNGNQKFTNFELAKKKFKNKGYELPRVVFWNVNSINKQVPVTMHESGTALVSGASPRIFDMVTSGDIDPYKIMTDIINSERYEKISG